MGTIKSEVVEQSSQQPAVGKITQTFERAKHEGRGVIIPYFMCGYPTAKAWSTLSWLQPKEQVVLILLS